MLLIGKVLGIALVIGGLLLWSAKVLPPMPDIFTIDAKRNVPLIASPLPASEDGYAVLTGFVVYDSDIDSPVAYIA